MPLNAHREQIHLRASVEKTEKKASVPKKTKKRQKKHRLLAHCQFARHQMQCVKNLFLEIVGRELSVMENLS